MSVPPTHELHFSRIFDAPRALVFSCMIDPDHLAQFWGPTGTQAPREHIRVDARPGGVFETLMVNEADGSTYATRAVYDEVTPPERLSWTEVHTGMQVTTEFVELAPDRTEVRIRQTRVPEALLHADLQAGFQSALDRFAAHLATLTAAGPAVQRDPSTSKERPR